MGKINWGKVVLGGLVAGIIIDVVEGILEGVILGPEWRQAMQALGHPLRETGTNVALHVLLGFAYGLTALWLYAAIRPRFGAGPKTSSMVRTVIGPRFSALMPGSIAMRSPAITTASFEG